MRKWGRKITSALVAALLAVNLMVPAGVYAAPRFDEGVETESGEPVKDMSAEKLSLTVKAADQEWTYDGEAHSCDDVVITAGTLLPGHVLSAENSGEVTNVSDSGIGNNTVSFVKIMNGEEDVTALYKIDTQAGNLTITPKKLDGDAIRISDEDIVYDGSKKTPEIVVMDGDKVVPKEEYTEPRYSHNINAGEATVTVRDLEGGNYIVSGSRKFTIKGAPVTVKAYNSSKDYGENDPTLSASVSGILMTDPIDIVYEVDREEGEDAGTYTITPTGDKAQGNYEVIYETGTFTINRKKVSNPTITLSQDEYTYDGTAHEPKVTVKDGEVTIPEDQYTVSYEDNVNAGTAKVTVTGKEIGNYEFSGTKNFTIKKAAVTVKADDKKKEYGSADPELTAAVTGLVANDKISYTLTREEGESAGTYVITASGDAVQGNYSVVYESAVLTIKNKTVSDPVITLSLEEYTYDGEKHEPKITVKDGEVTIPEDQYKVSYENNVNAGTATVIVTGKETGNYEFSGTKNFTIKKAAVTVKADDKTKEYSAADPELTAAVTGLVANDKISYTLTREEGESAGTYVITPNGDAVQGNYTVQYIPGILTIKEKPRTEYFCKEGDNYVHTKGSKKEMRVVFDSAKGGAEVMKHLTGVYVENDAIPQKFMKLSIGSVIIDVSPEYLDTLSIGEHSLTASFDDGNSVTIKFSVVEADKKENSKTETKKTDAGKTETKKTDKNVATGDDMNMLLIVMLMMSSVAGAACIYKKKKRDK